MKIIYKDNQRKILLICEDKRVMEVKFFDSFLNNIYRGKIVNKIDSLNSFFVEIGGNETLFLKSTLDYKVGDNVIIQYVRDPANGKLALGSENFRIDNQSYYVNRYPLSQKPKLKKNAKKDKQLYKQLLEEKQKLINEEKFYPTPKLLIEKSSLNSFIDEYEDYNIIEAEIETLDEFKELKENLSLKKLTYDDVGIILDELETLTVVDVNTQAKKSKMKKDDFLRHVNLKLIDFIIYNLKLRNIGGMVVIDFLRNDDKDIIIEKVEKSIEKYKLEAEIFGFSSMGLFEMIIKRRGNSLKAELLKRNLFS